MIIGQGYEIDGALVKSNEQYALWDNRILKNLVVSQTTLNPGRATNGHKHEGLEEVYIFTYGHGTIQVDDKLYPVEAGYTVIIPAGAFHKVAAGTRTALKFIAIFESYER